MSPLKFIHKQRLYKKKRPFGTLKNRWIQTPQRILMDPCIKQASVLSKRFWIIPWPLAYNRLELDCIRKIINFWYTFGWKWRVFVTIYDCRTHVCMTSMTSSVERTDLNFKISVALILSFRTDMSWQTMQPQLEEQSDQGLHCLQFQLHVLTHYPLVKRNCSSFMIITTAIFCVSEFLVVLLNGYAVVMITTWATSWENLF